MPVPGRGIKLVTLWFAGQHSIHWATGQIFQIYFCYWFLWFNSIMNWEHTNFYFNGPRYCLSQWTLHVHLRNMYSAVIGWGVPYVSVRWWLIVLSTSSVPMQMLYLAFLWIAYCWMFKSFDITVELFPPLILSIFPCILRSYYEMHTHL